MSIRGIAMHVAIILMASLWAAPSYSQMEASDELYDYLVQDVCVDGNDQIIAGDPANCANHRNIRLGEPSNYIVTDLDTATGATEEAQNSFPMMGTDGNIKVMISRSNEGNFTSGFHYMHKPNYGFDLLDLSYKDYSSTIRTSDGGCFDSAWSSDGGTDMPDRAGGWIMFPYTPPSSWAVATWLKHWTYHIQISQGLNKENCKDGRSYGVTWWNSPVPVRFESGKTLSAIMVDHYADENMSSQINLMERFYYTREYGGTRWETWETRSRCLVEHQPDTALCYPENTGADPFATKCGTLNRTDTPYPALDHHGGIEWVRTACRDHTHYVGLQTPQLMLEESMARSNNIIDVVLGVHINGSGTNGTYVARGSYLTGNQSWVSPNGRVKLTAQSDFNVVLSVDDQPIWSTNTAGQASMGMLVFQDDGNLVLYDSGGVARWASGTSGQKTAALYIQDDGNTAIYYGVGGGPVYWSSNTCCH